MNSFEKFDTAWRLRDIPECASAVLDYCNANLIGLADPMPDETRQAISEFLEELTNAPVPIDNPAAFESVCRVIFRRIVEGTQGNSQARFLN
ncbi:MAG: hypothetical protein V4649_07110 [Bacteroidota bacterium]